MSANANGSARQLKHYGVGKEGSLFVNVHRERRAALAGSPLWLRVVKRVIWIRLRCPVALAQVPAADTASLARSVRIMVSLFRQTEDEKRGAPRDMGTQDLRPEMRM